MRYEISEEQRTQIQDHFRTVDSVGALNYICDQGISTLETLKSHLYKRGISPKEISRIASTLEDVVGREGRDLMQDLAPHVDIEDEEADNQTIVLYQAAQTIEERTGMQANRAYAELREYLGEDDIIALDVDEPVFGTIVVKGYARRSDTEGIALKLGQDDGYVVIVDESEVDNGLTGFEEEE